MKVIFACILILFVLVCPIWMGQWCSYNTELLVEHYSGDEVSLPDWPFVIGAYCTQCALPYGIVTEIWCHVVEKK